jgi:Integrin beta chain VWA domain
MRLSPDARLFEEKVREAPISGNIDNPEGGFDALLQVSHLAVIIGIFKTNPVPYRSVLARSVPFHPSCFLSNGNLAHACRNPYCKWKAQYG